MQWRRASEIVAGLILTDRVSADAVDHSMLDTPYDKMVAMKKDGKRQVDMLDGGVGLHAIQIAKDAAKAIEGDPYQYMELCEIASRRVWAAQRMAPVVRALEQGEDADLGRILEAIGQLETGYRQWTTADNIEPEKMIYVPSYYKPLDTYVGGYPAAGLTIVAGITGCVAANTVVGINRAGKSQGMTVEHITHMSGGGSAGGKIWRSDIATRVRARYDDGTIRLAPLASALYSGIQDTWRLIATSGNSIRATSNHPFLTESGWRPLSELKSGMRVWVDGGQKARGRQVRKYYKYRHRLVYHPYARGQGRTYPPSRFKVPLHRLVVEAAMNNLPLESFLEKCKTEYANELCFLDPEVWAVHHKDGNIYNNEFKNLEVMTHEDHFRYEAHHGTWKNVIYKSKLVEVVSIEHYGSEPTFDLSLAEEPHNFIANGFVVHNTGKTTFLIELARNCIRHNKRCAILTLEMTMPQIMYRTLEVDPDITKDHLKLLHLSDDVYNIDEAYASAVRLASQHKLHFIGIDYADMLVGRGEQSESVMGRIYNSLAVLAKKIRIPIILIAQYRRTDGKIPTINDIRYSGRAEQAASMILLLYNQDLVWSRSKMDDEIIPYEEGFAHIVIGKTRYKGNQPSSIGAIAVRWDREHGRWGNTVGRFPAAWRELTGRI